MPRTDIDPETIEPTAGRAVVKRAPISEMRGKLHLPKTSRARDSYTFEAEVVSINATLCDDAVDVKVGNRIFVSAHIGEDDSRFIPWQGQEFIIIPTDAIQAVAA